MLKENRIGKEGHPSPQGGIFQTPKYQAGYYYYPLDSRPRGHGFESHYIRCDKAESLYWRLDLSRILFGEGLLSVSILTVLPVHNASCPYLCSTLYWKSDWATRLSQAKLWANWSPISPHVSFMLDIIPLILPDYDDVVDDDFFPNVIPTDSTDSLRSYMVTIITLHSALMQLGGLI